MVGTYIGPILHLKGAKALLQKKDDKLLAQFDDVMLTMTEKLQYGPFHPQMADKLFPYDKSLGYNWHEFSLTDFEIEIDKE
jgi:hypothetical protein